MTPSSFRDKVTKGFAWTHLYKFAEYGLINLYNVLVIRQFGPELVGPYALYLSAGTLLSLIGAFAVDGVLLRYISHAFDTKGDKPEMLQEPYSFLHRLFAFRLLSISVISAIVLIAVLMLRPFFDSSVAGASSLLVLWPYVILFLFCQATTAFSTFTMMGLLEARLVFLSSLASRTILISLGVFAFMTNTLVLELAVQIHVGTSMLHAVLLFVAMKRVVAIQIGRAITSWSTGVVRELLAFVSSRKYLAGFLGSSVMAYGITTWGTDILSSVLSRQPDVIMLTAILGERSSQIGYYQVAAMVLLLAEYALLFGLGGTLVAAFSSLSREDALTDSKSYPRLAKARRNVFNFQVAATTPLFIFLIFYATPFIQFLFGAAFLPTVPMVQAGLVVLLVTVGLVGGGMHVTSLVSIGRQRTVFNVRLAWGLVNLIANYFLIIWLGAIGALLGTQLANLGACATEGIIADRQIGGSRDLTAVSSIVLISLIAVIIPGLAITYLDLGDLLSLLFGGILSVSAYLSLAILLRVDAVIQVLNRLSQAFLHRPFSRATVKEVLQ